MLDSKDLVMRSRRIIDIVYKTAGFPHPRVNGNTRKREYLIPRQVSIYLINKNIRVTTDTFFGINMSYEMIGRIVAQHTKRSKDINHATIISSIRVVEDQLSSKGPVAEQIQKLVELAQEECEGLPIAKEPEEITEFLTQPIYAI